ncbi:hypothetical protein ACFL7M_10125 [Thermodesulfobacteriota bacterium]
MKDSAKTKTQLIDELIKTRVRIAELEKGKTACNSAIQDLYATKNTWPGERMLHDELELQGQINDSEERGKIQRYS